MAAAHPTTSELKVAGGWASEAGRRAHNEDYAGLLLPGDPRLAAAVVADGVGGARGGRIAAELAARAFIDACGGCGEAMPLRREAVRALEALNRWIFAMARQDPLMARAACAFTGVVLRGRTLHVFHVGDTRLYRLRGREFTPLTRDHRLGGSAHVLTRALGAEEGLRVDYLDERIEARDRFLLCSDGLTGSLSDRRLRHELGRGEGPEATARRLVAAALEGGADDNVTALVLDVLAAPSPDALDLSAEANRLPIVPPPSTGAKIDGFELGELLADGRHARVFRARDLSNERVVAVKFPKGQVRGAEHAMRSALVRETWVATRVRSPWLGAVVEPEAGRQSALYLVLPYYPGESLERRLWKPSPISAADGVAAALKLAKAVAALHRAGVIHRDIKPANVILEPGGGLRLIDFGAARLPDLEETPGEVAGTPGFMAPELFQGAAADALTDVFALGVTLYQMFSGGALPYGEIDGPPRFRSPTALSRHRPDLPAWLEAVVMQAVAAERERRPQDAMELAFALENGALEAPPLRKPQPLLERDPVRFWQMVSLALLILLVLALRR